MKTILGEEPSKGPAIRVMVRTYWIAICTARFVICTERFVICTAKIVIGHANIMIGIARFVRVWPVCDRECYSRENDCF